MTFRFGFSPCPNDTFMFEAIYNQKIDLGAYRFEFVIEDVEALNQRALNGELDITKISFNAFTKCTHVYQLLHSGSALGKSCGPLLIVNNEFGASIGSETKVAIPGVNTTANLLLSLAYPELKQKQEALFSDIEDLVKDGKVDAGLIIHENRFTYQDKGLKKVKDLGEYWEEETKTPIPLGGIAIKRKIDSKIQSEINQILKKSIEFAFANNSQESDFVSENAQEMEKSVLNSHIELYVNSYSLDLEESGQNAVFHLFRLLEEKKLIENIKKPIFIQI